MAVVRSDFSFKFNELSLSGMFQTANNTEFFNNVNVRYNGINYQDYIQVEWVQNGEFLLSIFGGRNLQVNSNGAVTGGTVTGYLEFYFDGSEYVPYLEIERVDVPAQALYRAVVTQNSADERKLFQRELSGNDRLELSNENDRAFGFNGRDKIFAFDGNDQIFGGNGADFLDAGRGRDVVNGGAGRDLMRVGNDSQRDLVKFDKATDSQRGNKRDVVQQFDPDEDKLDLKRIDANEDRGGNQTFRFSNGAQEYSVWVNTKGSDSIVRADVDGDGRSDFEVLVRNAQGLDQGDFIL